MRMKLDIPSGGIALLIGAINGRLARALTEGMAETTVGFKKEIRGLVRQNFRRTPPVARAQGLNFEKSFQAESFPSKRGKFSLNPAAFFVAKARAAEAFEEGETVGGKRYLAIALPATRRLRMDYSRVIRGATSTFAKATNIAALVERFGPLRRIPARGSDIILAADAEAAATAGLKPRGKKRDFVPLVLLRQAVRVPKKLSFNAIARAWASRLVPITEALIRRGN